MKKKEEEVETQNKKTLEKDYENSFAESQDDI